MGVFAVGMVYLGRLGGAKEGTVGVHVQEQSRLPPALSCLVSGVSGWHGLGQSGCFCSWFNILTCKAVEVDQA